MKTIRTLAICVAFAAALGGPANATGEEVLDAADAVLAQGVATVENVRVPWRPLPPRPVEKTFQHNTDYIVITDYGSGPSVSKAGAFSNPNWWNCTTSNNPGAPVTVHCVAVPWYQSGVVWKCDAMDVTAKALTNHRRIHNWAERGAAEAVRSTQATVNELIGGGPGSRAAAPKAPTVPDPRTIHWGQAAGLLACNGATLETATATQANPVESASGLFGMTGVTDFVCEARLALGDPSAPVAPYSVNCLDPGAPGVE